MSHPLAGCRAKITRADKHLKELNAVGEAWGKNAEYGLTKKPGAKPGTTVWEVFEEPPIPPEIGIILGDYVHCLRSALDHLVWRLVDLNGQHVPINRRQDIYFPVVTTCLADLWEKPPLRWLTFEQVAFIEGFQPYKVGDAPTPFRDLQFFWNADKHRVVNPIEVRLSSQGPVFGFGDPTNAPKPWFNAAIPLELKAQIAGYTLTDPDGPDPQVEVKALPVEMFFGERGRPHRDLPTMREFANDVIEQAAARFFV